MSDNVCQFFLRGRCQRENCEFKHEKPTESSEEGSASGQAVPVCHLFLTGSCKAGESCRLRHEKPDKTFDPKESAKDKEGIDDDKVAPVAKKSMPPPSADANMTTNDTSTFIASTTIGEAPQNNQQMARRVAKTGGTEENKEIRRDSKGFENFDDYFESDANDSTMTTVGDKTNESIQEESVDPQDKNVEQANSENAFTTSVPAPTETMPEEIMDGDKTGTNKNSNKKSSLQDLSKEWDTEDDEAVNEPAQEAPNTVHETQNQIISDDVEMHEQVDENIAQPVEQQQEQQTFVIEQVQPQQGEPVAANPPTNEDETIENIENFLEAEKSNDKTVTKPKSQPKEEWVTVIFGEDGKQIPADKSGKIIEKSVYDLDDEDFSATKATPFTGNRNKKSLGKAEGVTKIGNNTYYYTGEKAEGGDAIDEASTAGEEDDDQGEQDGLITSDPYGGYEDNRDNEDLASTQGDTASEAGTPSKRGRGYAQGRRKHNTNYVYGAKSTAAKTRRCGECEGCNREDCGKCPSCQDKPRFGGRGCKKQACIYRICTWKNPSGKRITPQTPNLANSPKGVPSGTIVSPAAVRRQQAGPEALSTPKLEATEETPKKRGRGRARKSISVVSPAVEGEEDDDGTSPGEVIKKGDDEYIVVVSGAKDTGLSGSYWQTENLPSRRRCTITPEPPTSKSPEVGAKRPKGAEEPVAAETPPAKRGRKPKEPSAAEEQAERSPTKSPRGRKRKEGDGQELNKPDEASEDATKTNGVQNRNISCLSDANAAGSSQREVVVECFAPYDDHRWVNIGKERNGMPPDAVQYARALRPPYQLLSFLRIKGNCAKGMGCSNKNTMVFVVLEGEITVVIHTTEFTAKKGDSFYIPPKNYYNLINNKSREAELSLLQYQYSGPLPSVPAGSQSGTPNGVSNQ